MLYREALGKVIREWRQDRKMTLRMVANDLMAFNYLSEVERGEKELSSELLEIVASGLGVHVYDLIIEAGYRMAEDQVAVPDTAESLFVPDSSSAWYRQYDDLQV